LEARLEDRLSHTRALMYKYTNTDVNGSDSEADVISNLAPLSPDASDASDASTASAPRTAPSARGAAAADNDSDSDYSCAASSNGSADTRPASPVIRARKLAPAAQVRSFSSRDVRQGERHRSGRGSNWRGVQLEGVQLEGFR
jgi:hypothetical protein